MEEQNSKPTTSTQQASNPPPVDTYEASLTPGAPTPRYMPRQIAIIVLIVIAGVFIGLTMNGIIDLSKLK